MTRFITGLIVPAILATGGSLPAADKSWIDHAIADQKYTALANPQQGRPDSIQAGAKLYQQHCAACHGKDLDGAGGGPPLPSLNTERATPGQLYWLLRNGSLKSGMPSWSQLPPEQRWQLITWIKSLR